MRLSVKVFVLVWGAYLSFGCRAEQASVTPVAPTADADLFLKRGVAFAAAGDSLRAEQYFLAAFDAGAPWSSVSSALVETCVDSGRLHRALFYVAKARDRDPEDIHLLELSASLHWAVGDTLAAHREVMQMTQVRKLSTQSIYFLSKFFLTAGELATAQVYLRKLAELDNEGTHGRWARHELSQLMRKQYIRGESPSEGLQVTTLVASELEQQERLPAQRTEEAFAP